MTEEKPSLPQLIKAWQMAMIVREWKEARRLLALIREARRKL